MKIANATMGSNTWTLRLFTFMVWAAVGLCAAYWAFKFVTTTPVEATAAMVKPAVVVDTKAIAKLLGATDSVATQAMNVVSKVKLSLFGLATAPNGQGIALIAIEDKPAKPYRVGAKVTDDLVLKSISKVDAVLAASSSAPDGPKLELPSRKPATFVASSTPAPGAQFQAPSVTIPATNAGNIVSTAPTAGAAPGYANTIGTLNPVLAESLRPTSRFAPRPAGAASAPVQAGTASTSNPAAAASAASAISATSDSVAR
jgi:general secretion pathway protein C